MSFSAYHYSDTTFSKLNAEEGYDASQEDSIFNETPTKTRAPPDSTPAPTPTYHFHYPEEWDTHSYDCQCPICGQSVDPIMRTTSEEYPS